MHFDAALLPDTGPLEPLPFPVFMDVVSHKAVKPPSLAFYPEVFGPPSLQFSIETVQVFFLLSVPSSSHIRPHHEGIQQPDNRNPCESAPEPVTRDHGRGPAPGSCRGSFRANRPTSFPLVSKMVR
jgi:hypothetical protein